MTETEAFYAAVKGDAKAITAVVEQYTPLVHKIVNKYSWMTLPHTREDLMQEGLRGIVKAIETFDISKKVQPMTWIYPQIRGAVQVLARKESRVPKFYVPIDGDDKECCIPDPHSSYEVPNSYDSSLTREIILTGCGSLNSKRAQIVCDRFGLFGREPMLQGEVAKKYGMSKQAINSQISKFSKIVREKMPELAEAF